MFIERELHQKLYNIEINSYKKMHIYHPKVLCERVERLGNSRDMR